ncbi:MAG: cytochrome c [Myxococcota bacterium]
MQKTLILAGLLVPLMVFGCTAQVEPGGDPNDPGDPPRPTPPMITPPMAGTPPLPPPQMNVPTGGVEGILDCPTVELPPYTRGTTAVLSEPFSTSCAGCHGLVGQGQTLDGATYPPIPGELTLDEYREVVRNGRELMPEFAAEFIRDAQLEADYMALRELNGAAPADLLPAGGEWTWSAAQVEDAFARGMEAWRKPDHEGIACGNCHSPDALDLAIIGYTDDAVLRRSGLHIPAEDAAAVVDLIHAQRRRFNITRTCARDWRPLQPGGEVLPGDTPAEQDLAFGEVLRDRDYQIMTGRVETLEDAKAVMTEMADVDLRRLPIGIALPRWTEDGFNGEEHSTINDYLMGVGRVPNDPAAWYAIEDRYVNDPSEANLYELLHRMESESNDMGFAERTEDASRQANGRCNLVGRAHGGLLPFVDNAKRHGLLIVQHFMRMAVLGEDGWFEQPKAPFPAYAHAYGEGINPFWRLGAQLAEHNCRMAGPMLASWPGEQAEEIPASDLQNGEAVEISRQLNHSWQTLGMIYDPTLLMQEDTTGGRNLHYWAIVGFDQDRVHLPFTYFHRIAAQVRYYTDYRGTDVHPPLGINYHTGLEVHPLLDGNRIFYKDKTDIAIDEDDPLAPFGNSLRCNAYRSLLLMQRELFQRGERGRHIYVGGGNTQTLFSAYDHYERFAQRLDRRGGERALSQAFQGRGELCTSGLEALVSEVRGLAQNAEDIAN